MRFLPAALVATVALLLAPAASALEILPYSAEALASARAAGAPVALHFHSQWCATCKMQTKAFEAMRSEPGLDITLLVVDFDEERELKREFRVPVSGVVIVLRGNVERARLNSVVDPKELRAALRCAL